MKKQQWLFNVLFSSTSSFNNVRLRPFCSAATTTNTNLVAPSTDAPPVNRTYQLQKLKILLEKKLPLLIVPYDHVSKQKYVKFPHTSLDGGGFICDGNIGFISLFEHDDENDDDDQLIIKKKKQLEELVVYKKYLRKTVKRRICGSSEGWLVTIHRKGKIHLLNPVTKVRVNLPPLTAIPGVASEFVSDCEDTKGRLCYLTNFNIDKPPYYSLSGSHEFREELIYKAVTNTSTSTNPATVVVVIIYSNFERLAFCRTSLSSTGNGIDDDGADEPAAKRWIEIPAPSNDCTKKCCWDDVTFYKGNFYAVGNSGDVVVVKGTLDGSSPFMQCIIDGPEAEFHSYMNYLVESPSSGGGDLLMVMRDIEFVEDTDEEEEEEETEEKEEKETEEKETEEKETKETEEKEEKETEETEEKETEEKEEKILEHPYKTIGFKVWKLNLNGPSWEEVTDLGEDIALFIGYNQSFSISASKYSGCRGNCIYFTDNSQRDVEYPTGGHDIGVYNLEDGSFEKLYETSSTRQLFMPPPVWYVSN